VLSDSWGRTTVRRLYAVGEVACTGVHGTNRLASTSLLEGLVFAFRAARSIASSEPPLTPPPLLPFPEQVGEPPEECLLAEFRRTVQETMWEYVGLEREKAGLFRALDRLLEVKRSVLSLRQRYGISAPLRELENMVDTALLVTRAALQNPLSFGTPLTRSGRAPFSPGGSQDGQS
jgi:L-aspartate oxidase